MWIHSNIAKCDSMPRNTQAKAKQRPSKVYAKTKQTSMQEDLDQNHWNSSENFKSGSSITNLRNWNYCVILNNVFVNGFTVEVLYQFVNASIEKKEL